MAALCRAHGIPHQKVFVPLLLPHSLACSSLLPPSSLALLSPPFLARLLNPPASSLGAGETLVRPPHGPRELLAVQPPFGRGSPSQRDGALRSSRCGGACSKCRIPQHRQSEPLPSPLLPSSCSYPLAAVLPPPLEVSRLRPCASTILMPDDLWAVVPIRRRQSATRSDGMWRCSQGGPSTEGRRCSTPCQRP